jgi:hypothetical protein
VNETGDKLGAFIAPIARDVGALVLDFGDLDIARAVVEVCCRPDAVGGLTLAEISARIGDSFDPVAVDGRLQVFVGLGMLLPHDDRRGTGRYILDPKALAGVRVLERITAQGGVGELLLLLDRTAAAIRSGDAHATDVQSALEEAQLFFTIFADTLVRLTRNAPIAELYAEVRNHEHQKLLANLDNLTRLVANAFPELEPSAHATLLEAQRYDRYLGVAAERVVSEGGAARDFGVLSPETWRTAAIHAPWEQLTGVASTLVFDAPAPIVSADRLIAALDAWRPRGRARELPPEPDLMSDVDPIEQLRQERRRRRQRLALQAESHLPDDDEVDMTSTLRGLTWPGAAQLLADVLEADRDPHVPVEVALGDGLLADPALTVAWCTTPVTLSRQAGKQPESSDSSEGEAKAAWT